MCFLTSRSFSYHFDQNDTKYIGPCAREPMTIATDCKEEYLGYIIRVCKHMESCAIDLLGPKGLLDPFANVCLFSTLPANM